ncbi:Rv1733c family protein [Nocardia jiangsuensis]|uniref:Uncharacterized protein n=1 Tax=Nocardia jiangsuensis TaxID=1691563 RepID=A0ABV8DNM8_9NOCA
MSAPPVGPAPPPGHHTRQWWLRPLSASPLLRGADRVEALVRLLAYLAVVAAVPFACAAGTLVYVDDAARIVAEHATRVPVSAQLISEPGTVEPYHYEAQVRWQDERGEHEATARVPRTAGRGDTVLLWVDQRGAFVPSPRAPEAAAIGGIGAAVLVLLAVAAASAGVVGAVRWTLDRKRIAGWEAEWREFAH